MKEPVKLLTCGRTDMLTYWVACRLGALALWRDFKVFLTSAVWLGFELKIAGEANFLPF